MFFPTKTCSPTLTRTITQMLGVSIGGVGDKSSSVRSLDSISSEIQTVAFSIIHYMDHDLFGDAPCVSFESFEPLPQRTN